MIIKTLLIIAFLSGSISSQSENLCFNSVNCTCEDSIRTFNCNNEKGSLNIQHYEPSIFEPNTISIVITCVSLDNDRIYELLPDFNTNYPTVTMVVMTLKSCTLPYKFSKISSKFPPIKGLDLTDISKGHSNFSDDLFEKNSPITELSFGPELIKTAPSVLRNLKLLEKVSIDCEFCYIKSTLFEENLNLKICKIKLKGFNGNLPLQLFHRNTALESVYIDYQRYLGYVDHPNLIADGFLSNLESLKRVELLAVSMYNSTPAEFLFENSTSLEAIFMLDFKLEQISR